MHVLREDNKLTNKYPEVAREYDTEKNTQPIETVYAAAKKKYWWKCRKCGKSWQARVYNRTLNRTGCPYCSNPVYRRADEEYCLATERPEFLRYWDYERNAKEGYTPYNVSPYSSKKYWWICPDNPEHRFLGRIGQKCVICKQLKREEREKKKNKKK